MSLNYRLGLAKRNVILASSSPRRAELVKLVGLDCQIKHSDFDESSEHFEIPEVHVLELSYKKAAVVAENTRDGIIIGADTVVVLKNTILGKPENPPHAREILRTMSGETHTVYTGFTLIDMPSGEMINDFEKTDVTFRELENEEIEEYVKSGSPMDKAGAYGIQDEGALFVTRINGCFYNVMGFPLAKFYSTFRVFIQKIKVNKS